MYATYAPQTIDRINDTSKEDTWLLEKWGCFSASEIYHLTIPGTRPKTEDELEESKKKGDKRKTVDTMWGAGAISYIKKVARQAYTIYNDRDGVETMAMKNGKRDEPAAFGHLYKKLSFPNLTYHGGDNPLFEKYCPSSGTSPDVLARIDENTVSFGAELKCLTGDAHFDYLFDVGSDDDSAERLKDYEYKFWVQCQFAMMTFKCDLWLFAYYNEFFKGKDKMPIIEIKKDENFCMNLNVRIKQAVKIKDEIVRLRSIGYTGSLKHLFS